MEKMEKKTDLRVQRTYKMLVEALLDALKEKNFDDITVGEICERAMVRRATFYKHFGDKFELFAFAIRQLQVQFKEEHAYEYDQDDPRTFYIAMIDSALEFVEEHSEVFNSVMESSNSKVLLEMLSEEIRNDISTHLKDRHIDEAELPINIDLISAITTGALIYTMEWWIVHDKEMPREELTKLFASFLKFI